LVFAVAKTFFTLPCLLPVFVTYLEIRLSFKPAAGGFAPPTADTHFEYRMEVEP